MAFPRFVMMGAAAALWLGLGVTASAQVKVGVVSLQHALEGTAEIKQAEVDLKARYGPRQEEIASMEKELAKMQQDMETNQGRMNDAAMAELQQRFQRRQVQYQRNAQALQEDVNRERQDVLGRVGKNLQEIIRRVAEAKGLDMVVDSTSTLYFKPVYDISADVTAEYDKAYPVKK
jgi:outer membrane protein